MQVEDLLDRAHCLLGGRVGDQQHTGENERCGGREPVRACEDSHVGLCHDSALRYGSSTHSNTSQLTTRKMASNATRIPRPVAPGVRPSRNVRIIICVEATTSGSVTGKTIIASKPP